MIIFLANNIDGYDYRKDVYNPVDKYINHIKVSLFSLSKHCDYPVTVYLIDCVPEIGNDLKKLYKNLTVSHISITSKDAENPLDWGVNKIRFRMMREKILAVRKALSNDDNKWVLFIDCDSIIRAPLDGLIKSILIENAQKESRIAILHRPDAEKNMYKFNSGVIGFTNTLLIRMLVVDWYKEALTSDALSCEQEGLYTVYCKMRNHIKLIPLEQKYNCWNWSEDPIIYHCKGKYFNFLTFKSLFFPLLFEAQNKIKEVDCGKK